MSIFPVAVAERTLILNSAFSLYLSMRYCGVPSLNQGFWRNATILGSLLTALCVFGVADFCPSLSPLLVELGSLSLAISSDGSVVSFTIILPPFLVVVTVAVTTYRSLSVR